MSKNARNVKGHLLWMDNERYVFRVYGAIRADATIEYQDYELAAEDIEVEILSRNLLLEDGKLRWRKLQEAEGEEGGRNA